MERSTQRELFYTGVCVVCHGDTDVGRVCDSCSQPMHHFCSHDIAELVGLTDFGEKCYCFTNCYYGKNTINTASRVTTPSIHNIDLVLNGSVDMRPIKTCAVCGEYNSCDKKCRKCHKSVHEECSRQVQMSSSVGLDSDVVICSTNCYKSLKPKTPRL
jgi:hypothetical protein